MKAPIVTNPTGEHRLNPSGNFLQGEVIAMMQSPATYPLMHRFSRFVAHDRSEAHEELSFAVSRRARAKGIPQEVEALLGVAATPVSILAVNDPRLVRMKRQATLCKTLRQHVLQDPRLLLAPTVTDDIVDVALKGDVRIVPGHPAVEHIMQKQVCQQWTDNCPLRRPLIPLYQRPIRHAHEHLEPALDIEQHPFTVGVSAQRP